jgi:DNA (cytosine-5)-methyltransferase 1
MAAYYNEIEPAAAHVLRALIKDGLIAPGDVDERSIRDVSPHDLKGYDQCHFFAGGGLWSVAARLAGWVDDRELWTGSCPCQPFSVAGKGAGTDDPRHLWPDFFRLIRAGRPPVVVGEQVAGSAGYGWFDGVAADLECEDYSCRAVDIPACAVDAPHIRQRLYWVAVDDALLGRHGAAQGQIRAGRFSAELSGVAGIDMADSECGGREGGAISASAPEAIISPNDSGGYWRDAEWLLGADGKARRVKSGVRLLVNAGECVGRVQQLRIGGNAIVAPLAAEVLKALMETLP